MDRITERVLSNYEYQSPEAILRSIEADIRNLVRRSKTGAVKSSGSDRLAIEQYHGASIALIFEKISDKLAKVSLAVVEHSDFDCVIKAQNAAQTAYKQVQLKQLPPASTNQQLTLQNLIDQTGKKYPNSPDLVVSVWINRDLEFSLSEIDTSELRIGWFFLFGDRKDGTPEIHGGTLADWRRGEIWHAELVDLSVHLKPLRFKPFQRVL